MLPFILGALGGYFIGSSMKDSYEEGGEMASGGYVAVSEKDGYWYIMSRPTTKSKAEKMISSGMIPSGEVGKVVTLEQAKSHKKVIGEEYLVDGGMMANGGNTESFASGGTVMREYEKVEGTPYELKIQVYYNVGGMNYFNYKNEERGYYVSVTPVKIERRPDGINIEQFTAFSGVKDLVLPVKRKSDKAEKEAIDLAKKRIPELKEYVLSRLDK